MAQSQQRIKLSKKSKRRDDKPSRDRYWAKRVLEERKIKSLMRCNGMSKQSAFKYWHSVRKGRVPDRYIREVA